MSGGGGRSAERILLVAPFDDIFNTHSPLRRRALVRLGCAVRKFDVRRSARWLPFLGRRDPVSHLARLLSRRPFDVILVVGTRTFSPAAVDRLRRSSTGRWLWWSPDAPPTGSTLESTVQAYDGVFMGGSDVAADLSARTGRPVRQLPPASDPSIHRPVPARDRFRANVVFAGRATARREALLTEVVEFGLAVWGRGWRRTSLREYCRGERLTDADYVRAYAGSSVAVNLHRETSGEWTAGCNRRLFELAAMGAAQVTDYRADTRLHFVPGEHLLEFEGAGAFRDCVRRLLQDPAAAEALGRRARAAALMEHTYMHRMVELLHAAEVG